MVLLGDGNNTDIFEECGYVRRCIKNQLFQIAVNDIFCFAARPDDAWVALEIIADERVVRDLIPQLKRVGAEGIIEYPLNKVVY